MTENRSLRSKYLGLVLATHAEGAVGKVGCMDNTLHTQPLRCHESMNCVVPVRYGQ